MDWAHSKHGGKIHAGVWWGNLKERDYLEDLEVDRKTILKTHVREVRRLTVDLIHLAQDTDK
jgi:hypothetical protein